MNTRLTSLAVALVAAVSLVGCATPSSSPAPTVTVTQGEEAPAPAAPVEQDAEDQYIQWLLAMGGPMAAFGTPSDLLEIGYGICEAYSDGVTQDEVVAVLSVLLVSEGVSEELGAPFGAALITGAERYLCPQYA
jgi:hypothetical protein